MRNVAWLGVGRGALACALLILLWTLPIAYAADIYRIDGIAVDAPKTKLFAQKVKALGIAGTLLIVIDKFDDNVFLSSRNLPDVLVLETREIDPVSLVRFNHVLLTKAAVTQFEEMLG